jgi:SAM-dependent methyltransferase
VAAYTLTLSDEEIARYRVMAATARASEADVWEAAGIVAGAQIADVGCGPGAMTLELADIVGPTGSVVGVDGDPAAVAAAQAMLADLPNAGAQEGQADATGLEPGSFDVVVMRHVLAHNGVAEQRIVDHLATLVRPGGRVFLLDIAMAGARFEPDDPDLDDIGARYIALHASMGNDLQVGYRLPRLLRSAGLEVLDHRGTFAIINPPPGVRPPPWAARDTMVAAGLATADDVARWKVALERYDAMVERPTMFVPQFTAIGQRPA